MPQSQLEIGVDRLAAAQAELGLSNEEIGDYLGVAPRTWRRWRKSGFIPAYQASNAERLLRISPKELAKLKQEKPRYDSLADVRRDLQALTRRVAAVEDALDRLTAVLEPLVDYWSQHGFGDPDQGRTSTAVPKQSSPSRRRAS